MKTAERLYLREMEEKDWEAIHTYASIPDVCRYQPWGPNSERETKEYVKQIIADKGKEERTRYVWAVVEEEGHQLIGVGELNIIDVYHATGEISYILHPDYWGRGLGTDIASRLIAHGFQYLALHRIEATCDPRNKASMRVLEKNGMQKEGRMRGHLRMEQGWRDSYLYSVLDSEYIRGSMVNS
ncbi:GNAT family N-acetyltransferase [Halobacillus litoralis]|uniref:GNAT family N-acetyltransferase n=1 Tax=Halobacillus litoralis TaxID=45668 RepID=UPI001CFDCB0F|nr:GNAT family protein [Halobacillus litoralis]